MVTYNSIQLIIDHSLIRRIAVPRMISLAILAIRVALLAVIVERAVSLCRRQCVWECSAFGEGAACCVVFCCDELAVLVQAADLVFGWVCGAIIIRLQDVDVADTGEVLLFDAGSRGKCEEQDGKDAGECVHFDGLRENS